MIAVVLAAVIVLRRVARSRRDKQIYEEYAERREAPGAGAAWSDPLAPEENE